MPGTSRGSESELLDKQSAAQAEGETWLKPVSTNKQLATQSGEETQLQLVSGEEELPSQQNLGRVEPSRGRHNRGW